MRVEKVRLNVNGQTIETNYYVSDDGQVLRSLSLCENSRGYVNVSIYVEKKAICKSVHSLVADAFIPKSDDKTDVNHINGNKTDNRAENLERVTPQGNTLHYHKMLRRDKPLYNQKPCVQIIDNKIIAKYASLHEAKRKTGISVSNIQKCCKGETTSAGGFEWRYLIIPLFQETQPCINSLTYIDYGKDSNPEKHRSDRIIRKRRLSFRVYSPLVLGELRRR